MFESLRQTNLTFSRLAVQCELGEGKFYFVLLRTYEMNLDNPFLVRIGLAVSLKGPRTSEITRVHFKRPN